MNTLESLLKNANGNIVGIDADLAVSTGYDSPEPRAGLAADVDWLSPEELMPKAEKLRLADLMLDRWARYKAAVMAEKDDLT